MNADLKKQILRKITYGMWVIASGRDADLEASSVTWVTQASFTPPLIAVGLKADTHLAEVVKRHRAFVLHLLGQDQQDVAGAFIKPTAVTATTIGGLAFAAAPVTGMPLLAGFPAWLEANVTDLVERGDHTLVVAEIVGVGASDGAVEPFTLAQAGWHYGG